MKCEHKDLRYIGKNNYFRCKDCGAEIILTNSEIADRLFIDEDEEFNGKTISREV